jgi:polar amino acid transport system substrate-binding protein
MKLSMVLLLFILPWLSHAKTPVSVCYEIENLAPFISAGTTESQPSGILVDMLDSAVAMLDLELQYLRAPWLRCQKMVLNNSAQATLVMIWSPERGQKFRFPDHQTGSENSSRYLWLSQYPVFSLKTKPFSLQQYQPRYGIGAPLGYIVEQWLQNKAWLSPFKVGAKKGFQRVLDGKLDGYSVERHVGMQHLQRLQLADKIAPSQDNLLTEKWFLVFNNDFYRQHTALVEQLWSNLEAARKLQEAVVLLPEG